MTSHKLMLTHTCLPLHLRILYSEILYSRILDPSKMTMFHILLLCLLYLCLFLRIILGEGQAPYEVSCHVFT